MNWTALWELLQTALKHFIGDAQKAQNWKVSVDTVASGPVTHVAVGTGGVVFEFTYNGNTVHLEGRPDASNHAQVYVGNPPVHDTGNDVHLTFSTRSQPLAGKPVILVFEFVNVTVAGAQHRIRFDCPK